MIDSPNTQFPSYSVIDEPKLLFDAENTNAMQIHPLKGLMEFGPYSKGFPLDPIRIGAIFPNGTSQVIRNLVAELESTHAKRERRQYLVDFPGFSKIFGLKCVLSDSSMLELPKDLNKKLAGEKGYIVLAEELARAINSMVALRSEFDVLFLYLPDEWETFFHYRDDSEDFDLHDYIKAITASQNIPVQIVKQSSALKYFCRASVMWRMSIALFCKAGGVPWKLQSSEDVGFVGISYAVKQLASGPQFVTCCSQVFDADGGGLEFVAYDSKDNNVDPRNPFLSRIEMRSVMARTLRLYQQRHAGRLPDKLIVHKNNEFQRDEIDGCFDAWGKATGLELLQIKRSSPWKGIEYKVPTKKNEVTVPNGYPTKRGTYLHLDGLEILLWTQGNAPAVTGGRGNYFKEGKGIPKPIALKRYAGHGGWHFNAESILGLTKMNWNNDALYSRLPVTLDYASTLAKTIKRMSNLTSRPYQFRFFM